MGLPRWLFTLIFSTRANPVMGSFILYWIKPTIAAPPISPLWIPTPRHRLHHTIRFWSNGPRLMQTHMFFKVRDVNCFVCINRKTTTMPIAWFLGLTVTYIWMWATGEMFATTNYHRIRDWMV